MTNTSATGGFLSPLSTPAPLEDQALADFFQQYVAGITGIAGNLVRPRWQAEPPNIPQVASDAFKEQVSREPNTDALRRQAVRDGMRPLRLAGALRIAQGLTVLEEVLSATPPLS